MSKYLVPAAYAVAMVCSTVTVGTCADIDPSGGGGQQPSTAHVDAHVEPPKGTSYHLLMLGADAAALVLARQGAVTAAGATYALGGPVLHVIHGQYARAGISLGLRVGLPAAMISAVHGRDDCPDSTEDGESWCDADRALRLVVTGATAVLLAVLIDNLVLAAAAPAAAPSASYSVRPLLALQPGNVVGGLQGSF